MSAKRVRKFMKGPLKFLGRARDFYVRSMTSCAGNAAVGVPTLHFSSLPRNFSANSSYSDYTSREEEDMRELIRIASSRSCVTGKAGAGGGGVAVVSRSRTVAIGRIDEDKACEFGGHEEVYPRSRSYVPSTSISMEMKEEKQRQFHEALLKMLYPPPPSDKEEAEEEEEEEAHLIKSLNDLPEEEIENDELSPSNNDDDEGGDDGKLTRAQRKRLRKRKLKEAASCRRKIIGPLLPASTDDIGRTHGTAEDVSDAAEGSPRIAGNLSHGSVEVVCNASEGLPENEATNVSEEEASCSNKNKLKQRRKSKKAVVAKSTPSTTNNRN